MTDQSAKRARELARKCLGRYFANWPTLATDELTKMLLDTERRKDEKAFADWKPTAEAINALPEPLRKYIHEVETNCDPAGMVRENAMLRDQVIGAERELQWEKAWHELNPPFAGGPLPCGHDNRNLSYQLTDRGGYYVCSECRKSEQREKASVAAAYKRASDYMHCPCSPICAHSHLTHTWEGIEAMITDDAQAALDRIVADKVREAVRSAIDEAGIILADAEIECGHKHVKAFQALEAIRGHE